MWKKSFPTSACVSSFSSHPRLTGPLLAACCSPPLPNSLPGGCPNHHRDVKASGSPLPGQCKRAGAEKASICQQQGWRLIKHTWISPPVSGHQYIESPGTHIQSRPWRCPPAWGEGFHLLMRWADPAGSPKHSKDSSPFQLLAEGPVLPAAVWDEALWWESTSQKSDLGYFQSDVCSGLDLEWWLCFFKKPVGRLQVDEEWRALS